MRREATAEQTTRAPRRASDPEIALLAQVCRALDALSPAARQAARDIFDMQLTEDEFLILGRLGARLRTLPADKRDLIVAWVLRRYPSSSAPIE